MGIKGRGEGGRYKGEEGDWQESKRGKEEKEESVIYPCRIVSYRIASYRIASYLPFWPSPIPHAPRPCTGTDSIVLLTTGWTFPSSPLPIPPILPPKPHLASHRPSTAPMTNTTNKNTRSTQLLEIHLAVTKGVRIHVSTRCPRARERPHGRKNRSVMYAPSLAYFLPPSTRMKRTTRNETPGKIAGLEKKLAVVFGRTRGMLRGEGI